MHKPYASDYGSCIGTAHRYRGHQTFNSEFLPSTGPISVPVQRSIRAECAVIRRRPHRFRRHFRDARARSIRPFRHLISVTNCRHYLNRIASTERSGADLPLLIPVKRNSNRCQDQRKLRHLTILIAFCSPAECRGISARLR